MPRTPIRLAIALAVALTSLVLGTLPADGAGPGSLDRSFGNGGRKLSSLDGRDDRGYGVAIQSGRTIVAARARPQARAGATKNARFAVARFLADGRPDRSFSKDGYAVVERFGGPFLGQANAVAALPDGKVFAAGTAGSMVVAARFRQNGRVDRSFGNGGKVALDLPGFAEDVAVQPDGKILIDATREDIRGDQSFALIRLNRDGSLDESFSGDGMYLSKFGRPFASGSSVVLDGERILAGGDSGNAWLLAAFDLDGTLDPSFGGGDGVVFGEPELIGQVRELLVDRRGGIVAAGCNVGAPSTFAIARFDAEGALDSSFGESGLASFDFNRKYGGGCAESVAERRDGALVAVGDAVDDSRLSRVRFGIAALHPDGELIRSFGTNGRRIVGFVGLGGRRANGKRAADDIPGGLALDARGRATIAGFSAGGREVGQDIAIARVITKG